jgi:hypothetical protein
VLHEPLRVVLIGGLALLVAEVLPIGHGYLRLWAASVQKFVSKDIDYPISTIGYPKTITPPCAV